MKNNSIIFDKLNDDINIFFDFLSKIKYFENIYHIKFSLSNVDEIIDLKNSEYNIYFVNLFQNIDKLEIENIDKSYNFFNKMINYNNNCINNIQKIDLSKITVRLKNEN